MLNVLITGAASGIGKACAEYFINNNHIVYALDVNEINIDNVKIEAELEEIFEIGFGYLSNCLIDINTYYKDYFGKDMILFNKYSTFIIYSIMLDDVKGYLLSDERLTEERSEMLDKAGKLIEETLLNLKDINPSVIQEIEDLLEMVLPKKHKYTPVYAVFAMIKEELGIY